MPIWTEGADDGDNGVVLHQVRTFENTKDIGHSKKLRVVNALATE